jgi:very-short-patch-repair endonuclease
MHVSRDYQCSVQSVARIANRQHGIVSHQQLRGLGFSTGRIADWHRSGRLQRVHPQVYAVGHSALSFEGRARALLLAGGPGAYISGHAALYLRGITSKPPRIIELVVTRHTRPLRGARIIHSTRPRDDERASLSGILVATPARALLDIAARTTELRLTKLIYECAYYDLGVVVDIDQLLARYRRRQGRARLDRATGRHRDDSAGARSGFEERIVGRLEAAGVPAFRFNEPAAVRRGTLEVDLHWPELRYVVEIDGEPHKRVEARQRDADRRRRLRAAGWTVDRIRQDHEDEDVARVISRLTISRA